MTDFNDDPETQSVSDDDTTADDTSEDFLDKAAIAAFVQEMRERHSEDVSGIDLPAGTRAYVEERVAAGDTDTLMFMLKLGYLMGLQTGFAAQQVEDAATPSARFWGPLEA